MHDRMKKKSLLKLNNNVEYLTFKSLWNTFMIVNSYFHIYTSSSKILYHFQVFVHGQKKVRKMLNIKVNSILDDIINISGNYFFLINISFHVSVLLSYIFFWFHWWISKKLQKSKLKPNRICCFSVYWNQINQAANFFRTLYIWNFADPSILKFCPVLYALQNISV